MTPKNCTIVDYGVSDKIYPLFVCRKTAEKTDEKVQIVNHNSWPVLSIMEGD